MAHNTLNPHTLLYIHVDETKRSQQPFKDGLCYIIEHLIAKATSGCFPYRKETSTPQDFTPNSGWRGMHNVDAYKMSDSRDYLLPNDEFITNSCCDYYLAYYRDQIPHSEILKLQKLLESNGYKWDDNWFPKVKQSTKDISKKEPKFSFLTKKDKWEIDFSKHNVFDWYPTFVSCRFLEMTVIGLSNEGINLEISFDNYDTVYKVLTWEELEPYQLNKIEEFYSDFEKEINNIINKNIT